MSESADLRDRAQRNVDETLDQPQLRLQMREEFYARYGGKGRPPGLGSSELAFLVWEIERGVLNPLDVPHRPGSRWWREVNAQFLLDAEWARLIHEAKSPVIPDRPGARAWLHYLAHPSSRRWYRAHNTSIAHGYLAAEGLAFQETEAERRFMNVVLYRVLFAEALVDGFEVGDLGKILGDPRGPSVELLLDLPAFYPRHYPLSPEDIRRVMEEGHSLIDDAVKFVDDLVILPQLSRLYARASHALALPELEEWQVDGKPVYPRPEEARMSELTPASSARHGDARAPKPELKRPRKIAILGGGPASLAAAYELTSYDDWQQRYEITLYQVGWRLGGKTATGRGPNERVEERGIHIFQGWYNNAFRMVQDSYACLTEHNLAPNSPFRTWQDAFLPDKATLFTEWDPVQKEWTNWPMIFPFNDKLPGAEGPPPVLQMVKEGIGALLELVLGSPYAEHKPGCMGIIAPWMARTFFTPEWKKQAELPSWFSEIETIAEEVHKHLPHPPEIKLLAHAKHLLEGIDSQRSHSLGRIEVATLRIAVTLVEAFMHWLRAVLPPLRSKDPNSHHLLVLAEFGVANLVGLVRDVYDADTHSFDFGRINDLDYRDWLLRCGLPAELSESAPVRFIYCGAFHNQYQGAPGKIGADLGLRSLMVSVTYRGSLVWKLAGGTGATLTAPVYLMLKQRGVKFAFFHEAAELVPTHSGSLGIAELNLAVQVELGEGIAEYEPVKEYGGLWDWPAHPRYEQLDAEQAKRLEQDKVDLESPWAKWEARHQVLLAGEQFDDIILGVPIRETERIAHRIYSESARWRKMGEHVRTTATFGVQLWLSKDLEGLGMHLPSWGMEPGDDPNSVIYADLLYSWTGMDLILAREKWPASNKPKQLSYYCGTWPAAGFPPPSDHDYPAREHEALKKTSAEWLHENMGWLWPKATSPEFPNGLDFSLLVSTDASAETGDARLSQQWFVANIEPSSHYTLAWPGSDAYRLAPDESGYENLYLCGDWTNFGLNIGHMEGAVTSGQKAAQALLTAMGQKHLREIFNDTGLESGG